jgi:uncharacterized protein YecT (DUF1311 family)
MRKTLLILLLLAGSMAHAASFDCTKAKTPQEKAICASPELSAADDQLAAAYKALREAAPERMKIEVLDDQRAWIHGMEVSCKASESGSGADLVGSSRQYTDLTACLREYYDARTKSLLHMILQKDGITFVWRSINLNTQGKPGGSTGSQAGLDLDRGSMIASWPQSNRETAEWKAWNAGIESAAQDLASEGNRDPSGKWMPEWVEGVDAEVTSSVVAVGSQLVTAYIEDDWTGGVHPNSRVIQFNWMLKEKRELRPADVFREDSAWERAILEHCDKALRKQFGEDYENLLIPGEMAKTLHGIIIDPRNWALDKGGLTIVFPRYSIGTYVNPADPVTIQWDELAPLLRPSFVRPNWVPVQD